MNRNIGEICYAETPDYSKIPGAGDISTTLIIPRIQQKILIIGRAGGDIIGLPLSPDDSANNYLQCRDMYADPNQVTRFSAHRCLKREGYPTRGEQSDIGKFLRAYYGGLIGKGCIHTTWGYVPLNYCVGPDFETKFRPILTVGNGLHLPLLTNHNTYRAPGILTDVLGTPSVIGGVPIYLPKLMVSKTHIQNLPSQVKKKVQTLVTRFTWLQIGEEK